MIILLIILIYILLKGAGWKSYNSEYISRTETDSWKGFFAVIILFSHMLSYMSGISAIPDRAFAYIIHQIGQMMVVPFLFFSGYGILESFKKKEGYARNFLKRRFLPVLVHFDMAVALFLVLDTLIGESFPARNYIWCWTGWEGIGNSNWFVFDILVLYLISFTAFISAAAGKKESAAGRVTVVTSVLTLALWAVLRYVFPDKGAHWYNTLWSFPLGMAYSLFKNDIETAINKGKGASHNILIAIPVLLALFGICSIGRSDSLIYNFKTCFFALFIVALSMKLAIGNKTLVWLGKNCFSIYILQRLGMNLMAHYGLNESNQYLFAAIAIVSTLIMAWGFTILTNLIDRYVLKVK